MTETKIAQISEILTDENGYLYVDLVLENGVQGYYPNSEDALGLFNEGDEVRYADTKEFAGRLKINGLIKLNKNVIKMTTIKSIGPILNGNNGTFYVSIETEDGVNGIHFSDSYKEIAALKVGSLIQYSDLKDVKDKGTFFVGLNKVSRYTPDERRQLSIVRQSSIKAAIEIASIASPKGRWVKSDGSIDGEAAAKDIIQISELLIDYAMVD